VFHWKRPLYPRPVRILLITNAVILVAAYMIGPIMALFVEELGGGLFEAAATTGIFALTSGVVSLWMGRLTDRVREQEYIVMLGYLLSGIGFAMYLFVHSVWSLFLVQILIGVAAAVYSPAFDALLSKHTPKDHPGTSWGTWESIDSFSQGIGAFVGGAIASLLGFQPLFVILACMCLITALYIYALPRSEL